MTHRITDRIPGTTAVCVIVVLLAGCYNDVEELLYPVCSKENVTYSKTIKPILERECFDCHSGFSPDGGLDLSIYTEVYKAAFKESNSGNLLYRIEHDTNDLPRMPYLLPNLDTCTIWKIKKWIDKGAPND